MKEKERLVPLLLIGVFFTCSQARQDAKKQHHEQTEFSMEREILPIEKPVTLSEDALRALRKDPAVSSCLESENLPNDRLPVSWFVASEIHLTRPNQPDLIVLPAELKAPAPMQPAPNACFLGPYTCKWWVLRKTVSDT